MKSLFNFISSKENSELKKGSEEWEKILPTLWLLGKTGSGKSSLIQAITKNSSIEIGNGFSPCSKTSESYEYPPEKPIVRFLDTRGLSEAGYDPVEDIEVLHKSSHALVIVMKVDDVEQSDLIHTLKKIKDIGGIRHLLVVHSNIASMSQQERARAIEYNQHQIEEVWGEEIHSVDVDFLSEYDTTSGVSELLDEIKEMLPLIHTLLDEKKHLSQEEENFALLRKEIIWYAGSAGASDLIPGVGLVSVPAIQSKMLHSLANSYGMEWSKQLMKEFMGALGTSFAFKYFSKFLVREGVKFIPMYGQTVGATAAGVISSTSTYALGRVACKYFYHKSKGEVVPKNEMQHLYKESLAWAKEVSENETDQK
ncbi:MAG: kinase [Sulfurovum sp.]|nr:MAG: kinase [Sulfurovum sp.]